MKIGDLAQAVGISVETIRFYEQKGLLSEPSRTSGNFRNYSDEHVERLTMIRHCRALDMSHEEIQVLLSALDQPAESCAAVNTVLDEHIAHVAHRIADLRALEKRLVALRQRCETPAAIGDCGIVHELATSDRGSLPRPHAHIGLAHE